MKPALHRSITFWAGILVMGFIGWAWWDSMAYASSAFGGRLGLHQSQGYLGLSYVPDRGGRDVLRRKTQARYARDPLPLPFFARGQGSDHLPATSGLETYQASTERVWSIFDRKAWCARVPHWLVLLVFAVGWCGLLAWRKRRRKRMTNDEFPNDE